MDAAETASLLRDARAGSEQALERLFRRYAGKLLALIRLRMGRDLRERVESRDILQAVWLKAFRHLDQFERDDGAALMGWLARIAENEIRDEAAFHGRQRRDVARAVPADGELAELARRVRSESSRLVLRERTEQLARGLARLASDQREVILLRKLEELSFKEIGERLERSPDACRMLLARAMAALTLALREDET